MKEILIARVNSTRSEPPDRALDHSRVCGRQATPSPRLGQRRRQPVNQRAVLLQTHAVIHHRSLAFTPRHDFLPAKTTVGPDNDPRPPTTLADRSDYLLQGRHDARGSVLIAGAQRYDEIIAGPATAIGHHDQKFVHARTRRAGPRFHAHFHVLPLLRRNRLDLLPCAAAGEHRCSQNCEHPAQSKTAQVWVIHAATPVPVRSCPNPACRRWRSRTAAP